MSENQNMFADEYDRLDDISKKEEILKEAANYVAKNNEVLQMKVNEKKVIMIMLMWDLCMEHQNQTAMQKLTQILIQVRY